MCFFNPHARYSGSIFCSFLPKLFHDLISLVPAIFLDSALTLSCLSHLPIIYVLHRLLLLGLICTFLFIVDYSCGLSRFGLPHWMLFFSAVLISTILVFFILSLLPIFSIVVLFFCCRSYFFNRCISFDKFIWRFNSVLCSLVVHIHFNISIPACILTLSLDTTFAVFLSVSIISVFLLFWSNCLVHGY